MMELFKKLFGEREHPGFEADPPQAQEQSETAPSVSATPESPVEAESPQDAYTVPLSSPLASIWERYGDGGPLTLALFPDQAPKIPFPMEKAQTELARIVRLLEPAAKQWLQAEADAQAVRAAGNLCAPGSDTAEGTLPHAEDENAAVPPDVDEIAQVVISADSMVAWIFLLPAVGNGKRLTIADWMERMTASSVISGVDQASLYPIFSNQSYFTLCPVSWGTLPQEGRDGQILDHFQREFVRDGIKDVTGAIDYRSQSSVQSIAKGAAICDIVPPVPGVPGVRVDGLPILPQTVKIATVPAGTNTILSQDGTQLLSTMDGLLEFKGGCFHVKTFLNIQSDIDYSTGNIDFQGDVAIRGNVRGQFFVKASGNISVEGLVEAATVEAGGDVLISEGISGNGQAVIRGKTVRTKYMESCTIYADKVESDYIMNCQVFSNDSVLALGNRGAIIGGQVIAFNSVKATAIGSDAGRRTEIALGAVPQLRDEMAANKREIAEIRAEQETLSKRLLYLKKRQDAMNFQMDNRTAAEIIAAAERLSQLAPKEKELASRQTELTALMTDLAHCRLESRTVYPGVRLTIGTSLKVIESETHNCTAVFDTETQDIRIR